MKWQLGFNLTAFVIEALFIVEFISVEYDKERKYQQNEKVHFWVQICAGTLMANNFFTLLNKVILLRLKKREVCITITYDIIRVFIYSIKVFHAYIYGYVMYQKEKQNYDRYNLYRYSINLQMVFVFFSGGVGLIVIMLFIYGAIKTCIRKTKKKNTVTIERQLNREDIEVEKDDKVIIEDKFKTISFNDNRKDMLYTISEKDMQIEKSKTMLYNSEETTIKTEKSFWNNIGDYYTKQVERDVIQSNYYNLHDDIDEPNQFQSVQYAENSWEINRATKRQEKRADKKLKLKEKKDEEKQEHQEKIDKKTLERQEKRDSKKQKRDIVN